MTRQWQIETLHGHTLIFDPPEGALAELFAKLEAMLEDESATEAQMVDLVYGKANPQLDHDLLPGRAMVTRETLQRPEWYAMQDMLARKQVAEGRLDLDKVRARFTMTIPEAAEVLGKSVPNVRQLIQRWRLPAWKVSATWYLDPNQVRARADSQGGDDA